eukprot:m.270480 g.270480  ORF g.270480 m.270480 type:complete len:180 (+) comp90402_c0_seq1:119-658(+)
MVDNSTPVFVPLREIPDLDDRTTVIHTLAGWHGAEFVGGRTVETRVQHYTAECDANAPTLPFTLVALSCPPSGENSQVLGSVAVVEDDLDGKRPEMTPWIATLFVTKQARGLGLGARLINQVKALVVEGKYPLLYLFTDTQALEEKLYGKMGFALEERLEHRGHACAIMKSDVKTVSTP